MAIYVLYAPQPTDESAEGSIPPTDSLPLVLDEETQFRCANFVQAEIDHFGEDLEENNLTEEEQDDDEQTEEGAATGKGGRKLAGIIFEFLPPY
jgi:cohesin complex subunit SA-1/2